MWSFKISITELMKNTPGMRYKILEPKAISASFVKFVLTPKKTIHDEIKAQITIQFKSILILVKIYLKLSPASVPKNTKQKPPKSPPKSLQKAAFPSETRNKVKA